MAVEDQGLQGGLPVAGGGGHTMDDHFQNGMDIDAVFRGNLRGILGGDADNILNFLLGLSGPGRGQVDLIDDGQHFQPRVNGEVGICQRLGLHAL